MNLFQDKYLSHSRLHVQSSINIYSMNEHNVIIVPFAERKKLTFRVAASFAPGHTFGK